VPRLDPTRTPDPEAGRSRRVVRPTAASPATHAPPAWAGFYRVRADAGGREALEWV